MVRMNLNVDDDIPQLLAELAGGDRKKGPYLTKIVRQLHAGQLDEDSTNQHEITRVLVQNLLGRVRALEGQVAGMMTAKGSNNV